MSPILSADATRVWQLLPADGASRTVRWLGYTAGLSHQHTRAAVHELLRAHLAVAHTAGEGLVDGTLLSRRALAEPLAFHPPAPLEDRSMTDDTTTRRRKAEALEAEWRKQRAEGRPLGLDQLHLYTRRCFRDLGHSDDDAHTLDERARPRIFLGHDGEVLVCAANGGSTFWHGADGLLRLIEQVHSESPAEVQPLKTFDEIVEQQKRSGIYNL